MKHTSFSILIITLNKKFYIIFCLIKIAQSIKKDADRTNQRPYLSAYLLMYASRFSSLFDFTEYLPFEFSRRQRCGEIIPLHQIAARVPQQVQLPCRLHAFSER